MIGGRALLGTIVVVILHSGCAPAFTHCTGSVSIQTDQDGTRPPADGARDRFILVSFWDDPTVNDSRGDLILLDVIVTENRQLPVSFPLRSYWVIWTPALGTQHLAPRPGIIVFHQEYPACWEIGHTTDGICCGKPGNEHAFTVALTVSQPDSPAYGTKELLADLLARKGDLIRKMDTRRQLTPGDKAMVLSKLEQAAALHQAPDPN